MRPHRLTFSGIGSYPGDVDINFDDLNPKGLYLIVGPTGAGKTTILDAMTYALYGEVAQDRENALASAHPNSKAPMIEFEFSQGDRRYIVHREPALPGKVAVPAKQWIREFDARGKEIAVLTQARIVTEKCRTVVGLSADEFMQVILLPQGKFQEFLMAKGSDKQKVLQTIFGTVTYRRIVDKMTASAKALTQDVADDVIKLDQRWAVIDSALESLSEFEECAELPDRNEDFSATFSFVNSLAERLEASSRAAREHHAQAKSDHTVAKKEAERFDKWKELEFLRKEHVSQARSVATARTKLGDHERAEPVMSALEALDEARESVERITEDMSSLRNRLTKGAAKFKVPSPVTKTFTDAIPSASTTALSTELAKLRSRLESVSETYETIDELRADMKDSATELAEAEREVVATEKELTTAQSRAKRLARELTDARKKAKGQRAAQKAMDELTALIDKADVTTSTAELNRASQALKRAQKTVDAAERAVRAAHEQRTKELAGVLAAELAAGEECPVCGSTEHPRKARAGSSAKRDVESLERDRKAAQKDLANAERDVKEAQKALADAKKFREQLPSAAEQAKIRKTHDDLIAIADTIDELADEKDQLDEEIDGLKETLSESKEEVTRITTERKNTEKNLRTAETEVSGFGTARAVTDALDTCDELDGILDDMEKQAKALAKSQGQEKQAQSEFERKLAASGYASEKKAAASLLDEDTVDELEDLVDEHGEREKRIGQLEAAVGDSPLPKTRPDTDALQAKLLEAEEAAALSARVAGAVRTARGSIESAKRDIDRIGPTIEEKRQRANEAVAIATVFEKGAGGPTGQLSLEVWVQRTLFEEVCLVANEQLRALSSNRYSLTLEQEEGGVRKRRGSGLDIYVLDSHTGKTRPVQTMSGGEQFIASLSLALALAEVVQRHAGGIELPCLFIDEGFGGLDLESLDRAIEVLGKIQASGRTIGIITHVETMQQQLPIGIRVTKSDRGSTLEVIAA